jgi:uncharacterized protein (DUF4415 family)
MPGSKTNAMNRKQVLAAVRTLPPGQDYVWDGVDEDDRPASAEELQAGLAAARKRGRPVGTAAKEQVSIRYDREVLAAFRRSGPGWQTRMNEALKDWLKTHSPA